MMEPLERNWPEYLIEAAALGAFMTSASVFGVALFHPQSPLVSLPAGARLAAMGAAMGATAVAIFLSPWGRRSGAHINPAVTLAFWLLGKMRTTDAIFYAASQFAGAAAAMLVMRLALGGLLAAPAVDFVVTVPGPGGAAASFGAEFAMSFAMMTMVLATSNNRATMRLTPYLAGFFVAVFIVLAAPVSGMSLNPARTFGSALAAGRWDAIWIYFTAPPLAMSAAALVYARIAGASAARCAKIAHGGDGGGRPCIFNCRHGDIASPAAQAKELI